MSIAMRPRQSRQFAGARIRHHRQRQRRRAAVHDAVVLHEERAAAALQRAGQALDRDIAGRTRHVGADREHVHHAGGVERAMEALVEAEVPGVHAVAHVAGRLRAALDVEFALDLLRHASLRCDRGAAWCRRSRSAVPVPRLAPSTASARLRSSRIPMPAGPVSRQHAPQCAAPGRAAPRRCASVRHAGCMGFRGSFPDRSVR